MSETALWVALGIAVAVIFLTKLAGQFVPGSWVSSPRVAPIIALVSVALLAGLAAQQTLDGGHHLVVDARVAALAVAAIALWRKAPFIVVIVLAAATTALLRYVGWG